MSGNQLCWNITLRRSCNEPFSTKDKKISKCEVLSVFRLLFSTGYQSQRGFLLSVLLLRCLAYSRHLKNASSSWMYSDKSECIVVQEMIPKLWSSVTYRLHIAFPRDSRQKGQSFLVQSVASTKHGNNLQSGQMPLENVIHCTAYDLYRIWV